MNEFSRSGLLLGEQALERLKNAHVAVFGLGGVGGHVAEALCRGGVGTLTLIDNDTVSITNINRQTVALHSTLGHLKTDVMESRAKDINPTVMINKRAEFVTAENAAALPYSEWDYIIDAIDTVSAKIALCENAQKHGIKIISAMGAGNKLNSTAFRVTDIYKTVNDPLARVMRRELRARGVKELKVVYSTETAIKPRTEPEQPQAARRTVPGSVSFVPGVCGLILAGEVIKDICELN